MTCELTIEVQTRNYGPPYGWRPHKVYVAQGRLTEKRIYTSGIHRKTFDRATGAQISPISGVLYLHRVTAIDGKPI